MIVSRVLSLVKHPPGIIHKWLFQLLTIAVFSLIALLYARPFLSDRTLMGNLEPFPDTFHYLVPAKNLVEGRGLVMYREGGIASTPAVPPLYSLTLAPIFIFQDDPRWFYVVNVLLLVGASSFLYATIKNVTQSKEWALFGVFLFLTNHFVRWIPSLAMAECLTLFLMSFALWLLTKPLSQRMIALAAALSIAFYATKYALAPTMLIFGIGYFLKILKETEFRFTKLKDYNWIPLAIFFGSGLFSLFFFVTWQSLSGQKNIFVQLLWQLIPFFPQLQSLVENNGSATLLTQTEGANKYFALSFFPSHWPLYWKSLFGTHAKFLWDNYSLTSVATGIAAFLGLCLLMIKAKYRLLATTIILLLVSQTAFMSVFYAFDLRYVITHLPLLLLALCFAGNAVQRKIMHNIQTSWKLLFPLFAVGLLILTVSIASLSAFKLQIVLNLKYSETPWWFLAIKEHNTYFSQNVQSFDKKPILISASIPYHYDFFAQRNFDLLPLSHTQDFARTEYSSDNTWGEDDYSDLLTLYEQKILSGRSVFITNWGLGNEQPLHQDYAKVLEKFTMNLIKEECLGACNLYKLSLKNTER